jgi:hypothetical protein
MSWQPQADGWWRLIVRASAAARNAERKLRRPFER